VAQISDILVIGGGVAGLSAAAALAEHAKVMVLEAEEQVGFHSSGRSAALLHYALGNPPVRRLTLASREFFERPPQELGDVELSSTLPILTPARPDELPRLQELADDLSPFTGIEWLDEEGLRRECPLLRVGGDDAVRGFIDRTALKLDGHALLQAYLHLLRMNGGDVRTNSSSTGGRRWGVPLLAKAAVAAGADGIFLEFHPDPDRALCDGPSCLPLAEAGPLLATLKALHAAVRAA